MLVKDIMTQSVKVARPNDFVRDVVSIMCFNKISGMPAVDTGENLIGVISEKDVLHAMFPTLDDMIENPQPVDFEALEREYKDIVSLKVSDLRVRRSPIYRDGTSQSPRVLGTGAIGLLRRPPCGRQQRRPQWLYASRGSATADYAPALRSPLARSG